MSLDFPLNQQDKSILEGANFLQLKALQFLGGIPILTAVPTYEGTAGEIVWVKTGVNPAEIYDLYGYISNNASSSVWAWRKVATTNVPATIATIAFPNTRVFNGTSPGNTWTDLDLSAVVGAKTSLVLLRVINNDGTGVYTGYAFRQNGDSTNFVPVSDVGANYGVLNSNPAKGSYTICITDSAGIVEWQTAYQATSKTLSMTVDVIAYIN